jgi:hypothetical protein
MMRVLFSFYLALTLAALAGAPDAMAAGDRSKPITAQWAAMDNCSKASFKQFPDYTADDAARRDAFVRQCLRSGHLPPRNDLNPGAQQ